MLNQTPFYHHHVKLGGKMVDFAGWEMPVQYTSITQEHNAVRNAVGVFDISHMGQLFVWGGDAESFLQKMVTNDVRRAPVGKGLYAHLLNDQGGVIDDIFIYRVEPEKFLVILNASRVEADTAWLEQHVSGFDVTLFPAPMAAALAVQGPKAVDLFSRFNTRAFDIPRNGIQEIELGEVSVLLARTGYTGEDGFELFAPAGHLLLLWDQLFAVGKEMGLQPCGLGARDTLRTEVGYPLYGHELDEKHTPLEAGLAWVVKMSKSDFIGKAALEKQIAAGLASHLVGFRVESGGVARPGGKILYEGQECGTVASGTFSPTLGHAIGLAYLPPRINKEGAPLLIKLGNREIQAVTCKTPFYLSAKHQAQGPQPTTT